MNSGFIKSLFLWEIWKFIRPALYEKERKMAGSFIVISSILFFIGVLFGYYVIAPLSIFITLIINSSDSEFSRFNSR